MNLQSSLSWCLLLPSSKPPVSQVVGLGWPPARSIAGESSWTVNIAWNTFPTYMGCRKKFLTLHFFYHLFDFLFKLRFPRFTFPHFSHSLFSKSASLHLMHHLMIYAPFAIKMSTPRSSGRLFPTHLPPPIHDDSKFAIYGNNSSLWNMIDCHFLGSNDALTETFRVRH
jgi:hypothetical protein